MSIRLICLRLRHFSSACNAALWRLPLSSRRMRISACVGPCFGNIAEISRRSMWASAATTTANLLELVLVFVGRARPPLCLSRLTRPNAPTSFGWWCMALPCCGPLLSTSAPAWRLPLWLAMPFPSMTSCATCRTAAPPPTRIWCALRASALGRAATTSPTMRSWRMTISLPRLPRCRCLCLWRPLRLPSHWRLHRLLRLPRRTLSPSRLRPDRPRLSVPPGMSSGPADVDMHPALLPAPEDGPALIDDLDLPSLNDDESASDNIEAEASATGTREMEASLPADADVGLDTPRATAPSPGEPHGLHVPGSTTPVPGGPPALPAREVQQLFQGPLRLKPETFAERRARLDRQETISFQPPDHGSRDRSPTRPHG